jgi:DNA/RNA-binding domain of Phe-tRNA-synthetase-like protein
MLAASARWKAAFPGASVGVLAMRGAVNPETSPELEARKPELQAELHSTFSSLSRDQLKTHPSLAPYTAYYRRFDKTYHVQHQLESVIFKGKAIPRGAALVEAMFMAELRNLLLTAGHDLDSIHGGLGIEEAAGSESYLTLGGQPQTLKQGDMFIHDEIGVLSSILYGPDHRTRITPATTRVLFTVYAPAGITEEKLRHHLSDLRELVCAVSSAAEVEHCAVVSAGSGPAAA